MKIKEIIVLIIFFICEIVGFYLGIKYREDFLNKYSYEARVLEDNGEYITAECSVKDICNVYGENTIIKIEKTYNVKVKPEDTIYFTYTYTSSSKPESYKYYYSLSTEETNKLQKIVVILISGPFVSTLIYIFCKIVLKYKFQNTFRFLPEVSSISFFVGMILTMITENDSIQGIGILLILSSFLLPAILLKKGERKQSEK